MSKTIRVSIKPTISYGTAGYVVRWFDGKKPRAYFVATLFAAKDAKARAKQGKRPRGWAVKW